MAILRMTGMEFYGHHGVGDEERERGGKYQVDCEIETDISECEASDDIKDAIDYSAIHEIIRLFVEGRRFNLMETLAEKLKNEIRSATGAQKVIVRVRKMDPPIKGVMAFFEVETK